jgi:hypothetical protein
MVNRISGPYSIIKTLIIVLIFNLKYCNKLITNVYTVRLWMQFGKALQPTLMFTNIDFISRPITEISFYLYNKCELLCSISIDYSTGFNFEKHTHLYHVLLYEQSSLIKLYSSLSKCILVKVANPY